MSEQVSNDTEKKTKKVVKKIIVKRVVKRKKAEAVSENMPVVAASEPEPEPAPVAPSTVKDLSKETRSGDTYVDTMDEMTRKAMEIAKDHLESSFNLAKCNGYLSYIDTS
jgi:membrane carboxypeptidase/penicillin-binding protein PbpC